MIKDSAWNKFNLNPLVVKCLLENNYLSPTDIQSHSLTYHEYKTDLILASKTVITLFYGEFLMLTIRVQERLYALVFQFFQT